MKQTPVEAGMEHANKEFEFYGIWLNASDIVKLKIKEIVEEALAKTEREKAKLIFEDKEFDVVRQTKKFQRLMGKHLEGEK